MKNTLIFWGLLLVFTFAISSVASADVIPPNSHYLDRCITVSNLDQYPDVVLVAFVAQIFSGSKYEAYVIENNKCLTKGYKFNEFSIYWIPKSQFSTIHINDLRLNEEKVLNPTAHDDNGNPVYRTVYTPSDLNLVKLKIDPVGWYVNDSDPAIKETIQYSIVGVSGTDLMLNMSKKTTQYNNGTAQKIETFTNQSESVDSVNTIKPATEKPKSIKDDTSVNNSSNNSSQKTLDVNKETPAPYQPEVAPDIKSPKGFWQSVGCFFAKIFGGSCR